MNSNLNIALIHLKEDDIVCLEYLFILSFPTTPTVPKDVASSYNLVCM